jgi:hypothetical protein
VRTTLRIEGDFEAWKVSGGQAKLVSNIAKSLGIDASQITVIEAKAGSIILVYDIKASDG